MLARAHTFTIDGLQTRHVTVEVDMRAGLPAFAIVGLADAAVREARERVRAAILNSGYEFPPRRITANLAPGDVPKVGPGLDLALACALLAASGQLPRERLEGTCCSASSRSTVTCGPAADTLAVAQATREAGLRTLILAPERAREARLVEGLEVAVAERLSSAVRVLGGGSADPMPARDGVHAVPRASPGPDLSDVRGQHHAVQGADHRRGRRPQQPAQRPAGNGQDDARATDGVDPAPADRPEAIEVTRIHSIAGELAGELASERPFRAPHHSITTAGLIGGARRGWIGEVVLAHHGVLFLDELSEFARPTLEALRQPLEDGRVAIVRARHSTIYPARFMLLAATNPCPCGYAGAGERCRCSEAGPGAPPPPAERSAARPDRPARTARARGDARPERAAADELGEGSRAGDVGARTPGDAPARGWGDAERAHGRASCWHGT